MFNKRQPQQKVVSLMSKLFNSEHDPLMVMIRIVPYEASFSFLLCTGFLQIIGSKIPDFIPKQNFFFYRLKVNKQVINTEWVGGGVKHKSLVLSTEVIK